MEDGYQYFLILTNCQALERATSEILTNHHSNIIYPELNCPKSGFNFRGRSQIVERKLVGEGILTWKTGLGTAIYDSRWLGANIYIRQVIQFQGISYFLDNGNYQLAIGNRVFTGFSLDRETSQAKLEIGESDSVSPMLIREENGLVVAIPLSADYRGDVRSSSWSEIDLFLEWEPNSLDMNSMGGSLLDSITHLFGTLTSDCLRWMVTMDSQEVNLLHVPSGANAILRRSDFWAIFANQKLRENLVRILRGKIENRLRQHSV